MSNSPDPHPSLHANETRPPMSQMESVSIQVRKAFARLAQLPGTATWEQIHAELSRIIVPTSPQEESLATVKSELAEYKKKYGGL